MTNHDNMDMNEFRRMIAEKTAMRRHNTRLLQACLLFVMICLVMITVWSGYDRIMTLETQQIATMLTPPTASPGK